MNERTFWKIQAVFCDNIDENFDFVNHIEWACFGESFDDSKGGWFYNETNGSLDFEYASERTYQARTKIDQNMMLEWVWNSGIDKNQVESDLLAEIASAIEKAPIIDPNIITEEALVD